MRLILRYAGTPESAVIESDSGHVADNVVGFSLDRKEPLGEDELVVRIRIPRAPRAFSESQVSGIAAEHQSSPHQRSF